MKKRLSFFFVLLSFFPLYSAPSEEKPPSTKYTLSVCAVFKNEEKFLLEWIEFHRLVGVEHFYLYNLSCDADYLKVLRPFIKKGIVTVKKWSQNSGIERNDKSLPFWSLGVQIPAYENAIKTVASRETKWLVLLDTNEFLIPLKGKKITDILKDHDTECGILLSQDCFDASPNGELPTRKWIIETTQRVKTPDRNSLPCVEKMIFKPLLCEGFSWPPYQCAFKENRRPVEIAREKIRINRYLNRENSPINSEKIRNKIKTNKESCSNRELELLLETDCLVEDPEKVIFEFLPAMVEKIGAPLNEKPDF